MSLREILQTDMKQAMKDRENGKLRLAVLRMVWAAIRNKEIDEKTELNDDAVLAVIMKEVKQREDTIKEVKDANRPDVVEKNQQEDDELKAIVEEAIAKTGAKSMKDMGKVMGTVMARAKGQASGQRVNAMVKSLLG